MTTSPPLPLSPASERLAQRRASAKLGWLTHLTVYLAVNAGLALLAFTQGRTWSFWPLTGWGIGLLVHGALVWIKSGSSWHDALLQRERAKLQ